MDPPVETYFSVYQFNVTNPEAVLAGSKPRLVEVGPYVYRSKVIQDRVEWSPDFQRVRGPQKFLVRLRESRFTQPWTILINFWHMYLLTTFSSQVTYRPRTIYTYIPSMSGTELDPDKDVFTVPNGLYTTIYLHIKENDVTP